jgi:mRNA-degrading endonuclease RelE of RelBE toxin-antitoxin system
MEANKINQQNNIKRKREVNFGKGIFGMRKLAGALLSVTILALVAIGGFKVYNNPIAYISMDINPSVELGLNFMNRVVSTEGVNEDGRGLMAEIELRNMTAEEAVQVLVQEADKKGYLEEDGSSVVALTTFAKNEKNAEKIEARIQDRVKEIIDEKSMNYVVYADHANLELRSEAEKYDISPGKYRLILMLQELDSSIEVAEYKDASVKEIMFKIHELKGIAQNKNENSKDFEKNRNIINETAQEAINRAQIQKNNPDVGDQDQNRTQEQLETQTRENQQTQIIDQIPVQEKIQIKKPN